MLRFLNSSQKEPKILASFGKDTAESYQEGLLELYKKICPGEPLAENKAPRV